ncbi:TOBE domain-containing protein [Sutterella sp.]|uniref:TOBE domain-containing protein n=1 Tax=Sutterella sp. TaxID=1981025 RepID=UPI0026DF4679|nr:TOBE domain-containing protein [Sutterella sp.]MDO5530622.1 LysR family transcriptional regulator [Sutterella sp.]
MSQQPADANLLAGILSEQTDKRIDILRRIADVGSISEAARSAGVSYKAAWQAIETLSNLAGKPLVEKAVGGAKGGGTRLTTSGQLVLDLADELKRARRTVLDRFARKLAGSDEPTNVTQIARISAASLATSMRNQFPCTIEVMKIGSALVKLILRLDDTHLIRASITKESAQILGLREGMEVLALAKATAVNITAEFPVEKSEEQENFIVGEVIRSDRANKGGECTIQLPSGIVIVGFARAGHGLKLHQKAVASLPSSVIVIALAQ